MKLLKMWTTMGRLARDGKTVQAISQGGGCPTSGGLPMHSNGHVENRVDNYPESLDPNELLDRSERYLSRAENLSTEESTNGLKADIHALRSLIYSFRQSYSKDSLEYRKYKQLEEKEQLAALAQAPDGPVMKVFVATKLSRRNTPPSTFDLLGSGRTTRASQSPI